MTPTLARSTSADAIFTTNDACVTQSILPYNNVHIYIIIHHNLQCLFIRDKSKSKKYINYYFAIIFLCIKMIL